MTPPSPSDFFQKTSNFWADGRPLFRFVFILQIAFLNINGSIHIWSVLIILYALVGLLRWYSCMNRTCWFNLSAVSRLLTSHCTPPSYLPFVEAFLNEFINGFNRFNLNVNEMLDSNFWSHQRGRSHEAGGWKLANLKYDFLNLTF